MRRRRAAWELEARPRLKWLTAQAEQRKLRREGHDVEADESEAPCVLSLAVACLVASGCSDENEANRRGVGATCDSANLCSEEGQVCLTEFAGGYCGVSGCLHDSDCPGGSACVTEDNQVNYCFLTCVDKADCNLHRSAWTTSPAARRA